jgi:hypothetical protein
MHKNHATDSLEMTDRITDFELGFDKIELEEIPYSDISIEQGTGDYNNDTIISTSDGYLVILENLNLSISSNNDQGSIFELFETTTQSKAEFTASIEKWSLGNDNLISETSWFEGPSMKLHRKDIQDEVGIDLIAKDSHPGHKHKEDMDKGEYELRVEHNQQTDGAINIDDVMGVLSLAKGLAHNVIYINSPVCLLVMLYS